MKKLICAVTVLAVSTAQAAIIFVDVANCPGPGDGSVGDPYCSIQTAIDNAVNADEIIVAPGTYFETINFLGKAVWLHSSDGPDVTTIDASGTGTVVLCFNGEGPDTVLDGFTITGGFSTSGGGMNNYNSSPTVVNCAFNGNSATVIGGGMQNLDSSPTVVNCTFSGNTGGSRGGGMSNRPDFIGSFPTLINCTFSGNSATGGGGGIYIGVENATIIGCAFIGNTANFGGAIYNEVAPTIANSLFVGNEAFFGGAIFNSEGFNLPILVNCTIADNDAGLGGGIFNDDFTVLTVWNSIISNNTGGNIFNDSAIIIANKSIITDLLDPLFVDPDNGDYRLQSGSPAIDAGHNWAIAGITDTDLDDNPRFANGPADDTGCGVPVVVDMGAYEFQGDPFPVKLGDIDGDGIVGIVDFLALLGDWGSCVEECCLADLDIDGNVGITDFLLLLGNWG